MKESGPFPRRKLTFACGVGQHRQRERGTPFGQSGEGPVVDEGLEVTARGFAHGGQHLSYREPVQRSRVGVGRNAADLAYVRLRRAIREPDLPIRIVLAQLGHLGFQIKAERHSLSAQPLNPVKPVVSLDPGEIVAGLRPGE